MKPLRLAVIFDQKIDAGGGYQQALNAALLAKSLPKELVTVIYFTMFKDNIETLSEFDIFCEEIKLTIFNRIWARIRAELKNRFLVNFIVRIQQYTPFEKILIQKKIDLVYFLSPNVYARYLEKLNYITTVWDLSHRDDPEFPEVRWYREFESREKNYQSILPRATGIIVDSFLGKINVIKRYGIDDHRIHIIPFEASVHCRRTKRSCVDFNFDVSARFNLEIPYVFYPAQFWAHKNHVYFLEGLKDLELRYGIKVAAIFSGGDKGNKAYIQKYSKELGIADRVIFCGFLTNEEIISLYQQSLALVMPTYFGPTNLPPFEAFELGVPVLYPDKPGLRDQVGDAGLLINLSDPKTMANHLKSLIENNNLREKLILAGKARLNDFRLIDKSEVLELIIRDYRWRRLCWENQA